MMPNIGGPRKKKRRLITTAAYRAISTSNVLVLASIPPIDMLAIERQEIFFIINIERTCRARTGKTFKVLFVRKRENDSLRDSKGDERENPMKGRRSV